MRRLASLGEANRSDPPRLLWDVSGDGTFLNRTVGVGSHLGRGGRTGSES